MDSLGRSLPEPQYIQPGLFLFQSFFDSATLLPVIQAILQQAPMRRMQVPGGGWMSASLSNCGNWGWCSSKNGYAYLARDPQTEQPWPPIPSVIVTLAQQAAHFAGFPEFQPDACLINRYEPGARMGMHQDKDELDLRHPIVSFSLGLPIDFLIGGHKRADKAAVLPLHDGDVLVFGGASRLMYHGVRPLAQGWHSVTGAARINLTLRRAR